MKNRERGFTLIEMLVVMAVILTLLGIILPSLNGVRDRAYTTVCANNMRQLGIAFAGYLNDNNGQYPGSGGCCGSTGCCATRDNWLRWTAGCGSTGDQLDRTSGVVVYAPSSHIFKCPSDSSAGTLSYGINFHFYVDKTKIGTSASIGTGSACPTRAINRKNIVNGDMAGYILLIEQDFTDDAYILTTMDTAGNFDDVSNTTDRHLGKGVLLWADGHVTLGHQAITGSACTCCPGDRCPPTAKTCCVAGVGGTNDINPQGYCTNTAVYEPRCPLWPTGWATGHSGCTSP